MASSSTSKQSPMAMREAIPNYHPYPTPVAKYEEVVASPKLFMDTLEKLHAAMGTKFMIPIIGGKDLDLHRLFVEVTSRGGIAKILREKRWKEVTTVFSFPSTATNASFVLRKYYLSLLHHYEQIYFFKAMGWTPIPAEVLYSSPAAPVPAHGLAEVVPPVPAGMHQQKINATVSGAKTLPSSCSAVTGFIDGKFESGYLVTVTIGSEKLKGVLYQTPQIPERQVSQQQHSAPQHHQTVLASNRDNATAATGVLRRRRRKKSEMRKRDPAHPKPNRSGYNFFFAEQHTRLKPLHPGKDREISRMIGESWTKMNESEKSVYQDKAIKDKERYRVEMEDYKERLRTGQIIRNAIPIQQRPLDLDVNMVEADDKKENEDEDSPQTPENEISVDEAEKVGEKSEENLGDDDLMETENGLVGGNKEGDTETSKAKESVLLSEDH